jgi:hypothetical protein
MHELENQDPTDHYADCKQADKRGPIYFIDVSPGKAWR